jgi:hypothetical protein
MRCLENTGGLEMSARDTKPWAKQRKNVQVL